MGQINKGSAIEFNVPGTSNDYIDLAKTRLHVKLRILRTDGTPIDSSDEVSLSNLCLHSLWCQVDVSLGQKVITTSIGINYPYKAILDVLLHYGHDAKDSQLQAEGYYKDTAGAMDMTSGNSGYLQRRTLTRYGICDFEGSVYIDCAVQ